MSADGPSVPPRPVQAMALEHITQRLYRAADPPWLHAEVARRMGERLGLIRARPRTVIDWWSSIGASQMLLRQVYPQARFVCVEHGVPTLAEGAATRWWSPRRWREPQAMTTAEQDLAEGDAGLLWANMTLHLMADPRAVLQRWQQLLATDGFLMFSTLGPGSLQGLRDAYARQRWPVPHAAFVDMHDLGDMLVHAGFADPVMDQETVTLTWADAAAMLAELRALGGNADPQRHGGLRTPRWREQLLAALQALRDAQGRLRLDFEVVYGHAFKAAPKAQMTAQTTVPLDDLRAMARSARRGR